MGTTPRRRSYLFNVVIFIITYVLISATYNYYASSYLKNYLTFPTVVRFLPPFSTEHQNQCELPKLDPWDPTILDFVKPYNVYKTDPKFKVFTKLENGILTKTFNDSRRECSYRCMFSVNDRKLRYGDWIDIGNDTMPECDVVETKCFSTKAKKKPDFEYMHAQIYRNDTKSETDKNQIPNVHIIVIDSMSHSALLRTMPKTVETLKSDFAAIPFPHLNKIGANSRPNAFGFLLGKQVRNISKSQMSVGYPSDYKNHAESCHKPIDDDQHIFSIFKSSGYTTAHMDDWAGTAFNSLNCVGFARNEFIDHTMKPFLLRFGVGLGGYKSAIISKNVQKGNKMDEILFPQLERFLDAYPDRPKFSLTWNTYLAHDNNNNLFQADAFFNDFFSRNKKKFDNSFIFFMGDHGIRWGDIRRTKIGEIEDSNPAFMVVLPEAIRQNSAIMGTIVQNSEQLVSHYDLFATFVDIAHAKHINGKEIVLHGSSILRPLPQPRTCDRLQIPIEFCTCMFPKSSKPKTTDAQSKLIASQLVENINEVIRTDKQLHSVCASLTLNLNASILVDEFEADNEYAIYFVTFNVNPGNGSYRAYAGRQKDGDITVLSLEYTRLDLFGKTAHCVSGHFYMNFCYCKELLLKKTN